MIIVNADDYGYSHEINIAVKEGFAQGILNRASILMNASFTEEAIRMAFENGYADKIGLHLNLTLGTPLSEEARKSKLSTRGGVFDNVFKKHKMSKIIMECSMQKIVYIELEKQIKDYLKAGFTLKHLDSHHHIHTNISIINNIIKLANNYHFESMRVARYYPGIKLNILSRAYKLLVNHKICKFNHNENVWMLEIRELERIDISEFCNLGILEIECHPICSEDGKLIDNSTEQPYTTLNFYKKAKEN